ncbi:uncharacterized protein GGS22DRAFT_1778 [Annulohypoxylon maeteangense]|uniref:uncharacterized protein n=1 Tax=Annulohypoxylon maeteangense TaxID=1927788 RepID=UPI0020078149|nr:uncharacterized protein GGS22DRAFT_1778 [Annulohypoxylon maeteangense]KAI0889612.1 hypothetical protein GGS22DRAFT_1778 [Annulohypoxylon maeteangense]
MGVKRTRSQTNASKPEETRATTPQQANPPSASEDDVAIPRPAKKAKSQKPMSKKDPTPNKLYKDTLKQIDKKFAGMLKRYKPNPTPFSGITSDDFAAVMSSFIPQAQKLALTSPILAFNLVLDLGEHAYGDLDATVKASGFGETDEPYGKLDAVLVTLINARVELDENKGLIPGEVYKVEPPHREVGEGQRALSAALKKGMSARKRRPNKQEWGWIDKARREDLKALFEKRRVRREEAVDWVGNALNDLLETGGRIDEYGIGTHYFRESIGLLAEIKKIPRPALPRRPREFTEGWY